MGVKTRNLGNSEGKDIQWQTPLNADGSTIFDLEAGKGYFINTTGGEVELKLPTGSLGDRIAVMDFGGTFNTNPIRLNLNGQKLNGSTNPSGAAGQENYVKIETQNARLELVFSDSDKGWVVFENEAKTSPTTAPFAQFIAATGGTVTTSGNFKIHTFTGDGCFVVSTAGNSAGSNRVDYLVIGGGGAGGAHGGDGATTGGGGGAGGYRESSGASSGCYTVSPRGACVPGLLVPATTYPITVGGGGTSNFPGHSSPSSQGSNSVFSTITSAGGGGGDGAKLSCEGGANKGKGGSGGGGSAGIPTGYAGDSGNTPPVSPPQGTDGGDGHAPKQGGGGGGAINAGSPGNPPTAVPGNTGRGGGGIGATSSISGTPVQRAGGGGGANTDVPANGGAGGGGNGPPSSSGGIGSAGTANTGGGGGGGPHGYPSPTSNGGAGGKGLVIIRYKFQ